MNRHFQDLRKRLSTCRMFSHRILTTALLGWCCGSSKPTSPKLRLLLPPEKHGNWGFGLLHDAHQVSITKQQKNKLFLLLNGFKQLHSLYNCAV